MTRHDRLFEDERRRAFETPLTRATPLPRAPFSLGAGISIALSVNK